MFVNGDKKGKIFRDIIYKNNTEAKQRVAALGRGKVINGTIGVLLDDDGKLVTFNSIDRLHSELNVKMQSGYAPIEGYRGFIEAAEYFCFGDYRPDMEIKGVSVSGGLAGIHHAVVNYTEPGDKVITTDWFWGPYKSIMSETGRILDTIPMTKDGVFDIVSFEKKLRDTGRRQDNILILLNTPAHNPTGYSVSDTDFSSFIDMLNGLDTHVTLFLDTAYIEFAAASRKSIFKELDRLGKHVFTIVDYSISKGFTRYGLRSAVLFGLHKNPAVTEEFFHSIVLSNRATYGSSASTGQLLLEALYKDINARKSYEEEIAFWKKELAERAESFFP